MSNIRGFDSSSSARLMPSRTAKVVLFKLPGGRPAGLPDSPGLNDRPLGRPFIVILRYLCDEHWLQAAEEAFYGEMISEIGENQ